MFVKLWRRTRLAYYRLVLYATRARFAFFAGVSSGLAAIAIDADHISLWWGHPDGRILHTVALIVACVVAGYNLARLGGLYLKLVLRNRRRRFCTTCSQEVDRLVNFCDQCGTRLPSLKDATEEEREALSREFERCAHTGWKCSRDHRKVINVAELPEAYKENGGIVTRYCVECGAEITEMV